MFKRSLPAVFLLLASGAFAQPSQERLEIETGLETMAITADCNGGVKYDDGGFANAYALLGPFQIMVMKFDLPAGTTSLEQVCNCFSRGSGASPSMNFDVVVYDDNGGGGLPGTLVASVPTSASGLQVSSPMFVNTNLTSAGIVLPDTSVYIGAKWPTGTTATNSIFMCGDVTTSTPLRSSFYSTNGSAWTNMQTFATPPRAMGIRADVASGGGGTCTPTATAMCLNNNRYRVEATWQSSSSSGVGNINELTDDTGYLWFFSSSNVEIVVKVLNGCGLNSRYWVFAAGLTDVRTTITVTDTKTGSVKQYTNPLGTPFAPVQDTAAFATCP
jgi:hypothetical protein